MNGDRQECLAYRAAKLARVNSVKQDGRGQAFSQFRNLTGSVGPRAPSRAVHFHLRTGSGTDTEKLNLWRSLPLAVPMG